MMNRIVLLLFSGGCLLSFSSCALIGNLIGSVMRVPGSLIDSRTEAEVPDPGGPPPAVPAANEPLAPEAGDAEAPAGRVVVAPLR